MSERILELARSVHQPTETHADGEEVIEVSAPASTAASFYEKVRTVVDYQEEHLLRRNAILRILKRFLGSDMPLEQMGKNLLRELIWAKYLPNREIPEDFVGTLNPIINKYEPLLRQIDTIGSGKDVIFSWVLDVMSTEIEYALTPPVADEALVSYMYEEMRGRINWDTRLVIKDEDRDLRTYIAIHKILLKSNLATLRFRLMTLYYPDWPGPSTKARIKDIADNLETVITTIDAQIQNPVTIKLAILLRRKAGLFRVMHDIVEHHPDDLPAILYDPEKFDREAAKALKKRTRNFRTRIRRTVLRAIAFLFLTKMLLALMIEVPYDLLVFEEIAALPLVVNILFPPLLLAFIGMTIGIPEKQNTSDYTSAMRALLVGADHDLVNTRVKRETFGTWSRIFNAFYGAMFLFIYGLIAIALGLLSFHWLSVTLFLLFLSLVMFFGIRIRVSTKDIVLSTARAGIVGSLFDFFTIPIVRAGRWFSLKFSKINVFIYFFDFIIESPLKVAIRFLEGWMAFVSEKKEEL
jgi:hypothetical protein